MMNLYQWQSYIIRQTGWYGWVLKNLFSSPLNALFSVLILGSILYYVPTLLNWSIFSASWTGDHPSDCNRDAACWVFVKERINLIIFGFYPQESLWRPILVFVSTAVFLFAYKLPIPRKGKIALTFYLLILHPFVGATFLYGSMFGIQFFEIVGTDQWGGLMLTLVLSSVGIVASIPLGILLALGRRSENMPLVRTFCVIFIEFWRGVPLITVLFMASVMLPLFLPPGSDFTKLSRALIGITLFEAAYMAEVIRGGLQSIPKGQYEACDALGLGYWKKMGLVILPQALKLVIPGMVNTCIALFKDTSLVSIIGLWDLLNAAYNATRDPLWLQYTIEGFVFTALVYFLFCFGMSQYSQALERRLKT